MVSRLVVPKFAHVLIFGICDILCYLQRSIKIENRIKLASQVVFKDRLDEMRRDCWMASLTQWAWI